MDSCAYRRIHGIIYYIKSAYGVSPQISVYQHIPKIVTCLNNMLDRFNDRMNSHVRAIAS